jgi:PAS domain S-box-containing protein
MTNHSEPKLLDQDAALQEGESQPADILHSAPDAMITMDENRIILMLNPAAEKMFGLTAEEALGTNVEQLLPPRYWASHPQHVRPFGETHQTQHSIGSGTDLFALRPDGTEFPVEVSISQIQRGDRTFFTAIARDLTERKRDEESAFRLAAIINSSEEAILSKDLSGKILTWNQGAERLFGYTAAEIVGKPITTIVPADRRQEVYDSLREIGEGRSVIRIETIRQQKDGNLVDVSLSLSPIRDGRGLITSASSIAHDISARKRIERELARKADELARSNRDLEQFAYVASHDLQEPLRMVSAYVQLLAERYRERLDASADQYIAYAVEGATRMQTLIHDLLAFSRVGRHDIERLMINCDDVVAEAAKNLHAAIQESGAVLDLCQLPKILANRSQLIQVFQNLISNAIKFHSQAKLTISVSAEKQGEEWLFSVADNGIGIAEEHRERIFEVFQRLHARTEYPGNGIGLAICKKIVEMHGGRIWVESEVGRGSAFKFALSASQPASLPEEMRTMAHAGA